MPIMYPSSYGRTLLDIDALFARHHVDKMHPEFARRLRAWLIAQEGRIGIGGSWRDTGAQPDRPGFAPEGRSFHQYQRFASGLVAFCAVDLVARNGAGVHRAPHWDEVPVQGSAEASRWGVHCNVSSESWHMQPVEIDGWASWISAGSPDPVAGYRLPTDPPLQPPPTIEEEPMEVIRVHGDTAQYLRQGMFARWIPSGATKVRWVDELGFDPAVNEVPVSLLGSLVLVGPNPFGTGVTTSPADFGGHIA